MGERWGGGWEEHGGEIGGGPGGKENEERRGWASRKRKSHGERRTDTDETKGAGAWRAGA